MRDSLIRLVSALLGLVPSLLVASTEPTSGWTYRYLDDLMLRAGHDGFFVNTGPYQRSEIAEYLNRLDLHGLDRKSIWLYENLSDEFKIEVSGGESNSIVTFSRFETSVESNSPVHLSSQIGIDAWLGKNVSMWGLLRASINWGECHKVQTKPWKDVARCGLDAGGVVVGGEVFELFFGRDEIGWGWDLSEGLLISGQAPSFDMLKFKWKNSRFCYSWFGSRLRRGEFDPWNPETQRYLTAHRVEFALRRWLNVGFSEAVIYGGDGRGFELGYLNPVAILYAEQWNLDKDDNILVSLDFLINIKHRVRVKGEILIDDFQYERQGEADKLGGALRISATNPFLPSLSTIDLRYVRIQPGVYTHRKQLNWFTHEGAVIGYPAGSDLSAFCLGIDLYYPKDMLWQVSLGYMDKGESGLGDCHTACQDYFGLNKDQRVLNARLAIRWHARCGVSLETNLNWRRVDNAWWDSAGSEDKLILGLSAGLWWRGLSVLK